VNSDLDQVSNNDFLSVNNNLFDVFLGGMDDLLTVLLDLLGDLLGLDDLNLQFLNQNKLLLFLVFDDQFSDVDDTSDNSSNSDDGSVDNKFDSVYNDMNMFNCSDAMNMNSDTMFVRNVDDLLV